MCFNLESPDGDQGYPGELDATVCYTLNADNELKITYKAVVKDRPTIVNLMCHPYFNLSGTEKVTACLNDSVLPDISPSRDISPGREGGIFSVCV